MIKAAWFDCLVITVSNNFPYKPIILKSYNRLLPIYTGKIDLVLNNNLN